MRLKNRIKYNEDNSIDGKTPLLVTHSGSRFDYSPFIPLVSNGRKTS
jgi:hypothetical protein